MMNEKARAARNAYRRQYAKDHPDKIRKQQERYWTKKAAEMEAAELRASLDGKEADHDSRTAERRS